MISVKLTCLNVRNIDKISKNDFVDHTANSSHHVDRVDAHQSICKAVCDWFIFYSIIAVSSARPGYLLAILDLFLEKLSSAVFILLFFRLYSER